MLPRPFGHAFAPVVGIYRWVRHFFVSRENRAVQARLVPICEEGAIRDLGTRADPGTRSNLEINVGLGEIAFGVIPQRPILWRFQNALRLVTNPLCPTQGIRQGRNLPHRCPTPDEGPKPPTTRD